VSARFGKQHINLINPIIDYTSLVNARKRRFGLHLKNTKDQLFPHKGLIAYIFSTPDAGPECRIHNRMINNDCCDKQQPTGFLGQ
jgi:hypothetical protein